MNRLKSISSSPTLRNYAQDASQRAVRPVADFLAPTVEVPTLYGKYKKYDAKHRFRRPNTRLVAGDKATRIGFTAEDADYVLTPRGLDFPIANLDKLESAELMNQAQYGADLLAEAASLDHEAEVIELALDAAGEGTDLNVTTGKPVDAVDEAILAVKKAARNGAGIGLLFGTGAYRLWKNSDKVKALFNGVAKLLKTPDLADTSGMLMFNPECRMSEMVIDNAPEGKAAEIDWLLDTGLFIFARNPNPTTMDSSFMKTFRLRGQWMKPDSYDFEDKRGEAIKYDWTGQPYVTNSGAIIRLNLGK